MTETEKTLREFLDGLVEEKRELEKRLRELDITINTVASRIDANVFAERLSGAIHVEEERREQLEHALEDRTKPYAGMSHPEAARAYLDSVEGPKRTADISEALLEGGVQTDSKRFTSTIYTTLRRLADDGEITKLPGGKWLAGAQEPSENGDGTDNSVG